MSTLPQSSNSTSLPQSSATGSAAPQQVNSSLDVPEAQQNVSTTGLSGATANGRAGSIDRGPRRSLTKRTRAGSTGSKRSQNAGAMSAEKGPRPASASQANQPRVKKKSFLSFLNCCGAPDEGGDIGMQDRPQPAKEVSKAQPAKIQPISPQTAQATTVPEKQTGDISNVAQEKAGAPAVADTPVTQAGRVPGEKTPQGDLSTSQAVPTSLGTISGLKQDEMSKDETLQSEPPRPQAPRLETAAIIGGGALGAGAIAEAVIAANPNVTIQAPTPVDPEQQGEQIISDRTPEQEARDTDIEMTDVGPSIPLSTNDVNIQPEDESETAVKSDSPVDLPPPPPLEERQAQVASTASHEISRQPSPVDNQKWLLPSVRHEHRGRKCLILDLDETLVHSSFKVYRSLQHMYAYSD